MKRYVFMFCALYMCVQSYAQVSNCNSVNYMSRSYAPLFIPNEDDSILHVRLNLIFIQKDDGTGNFQENDTAHQNFITTIMNILNTNIIADLKMPEADCFAGSESDLVRDMRIRFVDHRHYIPQSSVWDNGICNGSGRLCPNRYNWYLKCIDDSLNNAIPDSLKAINIYFTEDASTYHRCWEISDTADTSYLAECTTGGCSDFPLYYTHASSQIHIICSYSKYWWFKNIVPQLASENYKQWYYQGMLLAAGGVASDMAHELGHSFGLHHPNEDLSHVIYPDTGCMVTIMQPSGNSLRNFLPPQEIGWMYYNCMTTNLQYFIPTNTYLGTKTLNTTVTLPRMRMYYSPLIGSSGNVTMPCDMTFSPQGYIMVQNGGILTVNGASLQSIQGSWGGIIVESGGKLILSDVSISDYNIVVKSGGSLIVTNDLTISGDHSITIEDGGYLCVDENASIDLEDAFSVIIASPNAILGCPSCNINCVQTRSGLTNSGSGHFITYEGTKYLQNITISSDYLATGNITNAGYDVTSTQPYGNVVVEDGGELRIKANETTLTNGVEVQLGGKLIISK